MNECIYIEENAKWRPFKQEINLPLERMSLFPPANKDNGLKIKNMNSPKQVMTLAPSLALCLWKGDA